MSRLALQAVDRYVHRAGSTQSGVRLLAEETPIAMSYRGSTHAVMMATPADLTDFAHGFTLSEGIARQPGEILGVEIVALDEGIDLQIELNDEAASRHTARRRAMTGPAGCGLCGVDSIAEALRTVRPVGEGAALREREVAEAVSLLAKSQALNAQTGAVHAAGYFESHGGLLTAREDVGRHNALDKLAGALAQGGVAASGGAVVLTSRVSVEMVQKTAMMGCAIILAVSAPTALAVRTAEAANITLVAVVRGDEYEIFTHPYRIGEGGQGHVA